CPKTDRVEAGAGDIAARSVETRDQPRFHRIAADRDYDRNYLGRTLGGKRDLSPADGINECDPPANEDVGQVGQPIVATLRPARLDRHVVAFHEANFTQTLSERDEERLIRLGQLTAQNSDHGHRWLLRSRREWPTGSRAAESRYELATFHCPVPPVPRQRLAQHYCAAGFQFGLGRLPFNHD